MKKYFIYLTKYPKKFVVGVFSSIHKQLTKRVAQIIIWFVLSFPFTLIQASAVFDDSNLDIAESNTVICNTYHFNVKEPLPNIEYYRSTLSQSSNFNLDRFYQTGNIKFLEIVIAENVENFLVAGVLKLMEGKYYFDRENYKKATTVFQGAYYYNPNSIFLLKNHLLSAEAYQRELILKSTDVKNTPDLLRTIRVIQKDIDQLKVKISNYLVNARSA